MRTGDKERHSLSVYPSIYAEDQGKEFGSCNHSLYQKAYLFCHIRGIFFLQKRSGKLSTCSSGEKKGRWSKTP
ncbi:hypothetical protein GDO78_012169 [Eleutherodactylus coqui]|uniref:Uncharacterized protein n=1 Tax=Eleutherodactylus coqui TaxID=57060 RepID=A0A8J6F5L2_ELECQ|nr:hypothetical protein GDO78_012169 [Eleutherodactylus coqui]